MSSQVRLRSSARRPLLLDDWTMVSDLAEFLEWSVARISCLPAGAFTGQAFHRLAAQVTDNQLEAAQVAIARAAVGRFELSTDVLAFDTSNFDTHIATTTPGELARRGHAKSKRSDLRVVGLGVLVSETGHCRCSIERTQATGRTKACWSRVWTGWARCTTLSTRAKDGHVLPSERSCEMAASGASNWSSTSTLSGTTASSRCRSDIALPSTRSKRRPSAER
jgi:hypothetical protein